MKKTDAFKQFLTPQQREYIAAAIDEQAAIEPTGLLQKYDRVIAKIIELEDTLNQLVTKANKLEQRFQEDDKYSLTRQKLIRIMKEQGYE